MNNDTTTAALFASLIAVYLIVFGVILVVALLEWVLVSYTFMLLYRKVGIEPWSAWVPVYSTWKLLELGGHQGWLSLLSLLPPGRYVTAVFMYIGAYRTSIAFGKDGAWVLLAIFVPFVWAYLLSRDTEVYRPEVFAERGWQGPFVGDGARPPVVAF